MITVRSSTLESFRLYLDPDVDFITTEEIEARLRGESQSSPAAELGTAFHTAVADEYAGATAFDRESIERAREGLNGAFSEVYGSVVLDVDGVRVRLTGHADWLLGMDMVELKTSRKPIAPDKYADSVQWRSYALIFGLTRIIYRQVQLDEDRDGTIFAKSIEDITLRPYPRLREDVIACLRSLLAFARVRGCLDAMDVPDDVVEQNRKPAPDYSCTVP